MERVYLVGAEEVGSAAGRMVSAATDMQRAAGNISYALEQHQRFLDDWLSRLQTLLEQTSLGTR